MVAARMVKITPLKRSRIASQAGKIGNAVRWAGHVVPDYNEYRREWRRNRSNVEFSGGAPLHGAASAGTQGSASLGEEG
jgi:hypothetical protein